MGTSINVVGMNDIERPLPFIVDWKVALSKINLSPPSFFKAPTIERIVVILSVMCIVPKYHIIFCMIVIFLVLKFLVLLSFKTLKELLHLCFASLMEASDIPL